MVSMDPHSSSNYSNDVLQSEQSYRTERDTFGELRVPSDRYWGAQTQRYDRTAFGNMSDSDIAEALCRILTLVVLLNDCRLL
jgi:aspartate ammonia-lyase